AVQQYSDDKTTTTVVLETASTDGTTKGAARAARRLIDDHVVAVIGPQTVKEADGSGPVLAAAGIPALTATVTSTSLPISSWPGFLQVVADDAQQGAAEADELVDTLGRRQIALVAGTSAGDRARSSAAATEVTGDGATVAVSTSVTSSGSVTTAADQVVASGADGVFISVSPDEAQAVVSALSVAGFTGSVLLAADATSSPSVLDGLAATMSGALVASPADDTSIGAVDGGAALEFRDTFRAAFGEIPPPWAAESFDATKFVLAGISAGCTTPALLLNYLQGHDWAGVSSTIQFATGGGQLHPHVWVSQARAGKLVQISEAS
ncbi:MAG TPA: ABC transporter substrate-binding protein, partial [Acidimicrobiales bacterium]